MLLAFSASTRDFFLRLLSVTTHSTWSNRQFVQGEPFSTTSQRTLRARQQQHAFEARLLTGRVLPDMPAVEALRFAWVSVEDIVFLGCDGVVVAVVALVMTVKASEYYAVRYPCIE